MSNQNLPFTRFRTMEGRSPVPRVQRTELGAEHQPDLPPTPAEGRILRLRRLNRTQADAELARWAEAGARRIAAPDGWVAMERGRSDAVTGLPRRLRIAVGAGDPATVVNFSVLEPPAREDDALWRRTLERAHATPPAAHSDWHQDDAHEWAA